MLQGNYCKEVFNHYQQENVSTYDTIGLKSLKSSVTFFFDLNGFKESFDILL